ALPLLVEKPGRTKDEAPRRWHGHSVLRRVEVEASEGRVVQEEVRFVVVPSSQLAQQHAQTYASAPEKEAEALADHVRQGPAPGVTCLPEAEAAIAAYEGRGPGHRGRRPRPWRSHTRRYGIVAARRRTRRPPAGPSCHDGPAAHRVGLSPRGRGGR